MARTPDRDPPLLRRLRLARRERLSRRRAVQGISALFGAAAIGCGDDGDGSTGTGTGTDTTGGSTGTGSSETGTDTAGTDTGTDTDTDTDTGGVEFGACEDPGMSPEELLAGIDHIVIVMMENRSFDHYFGTLKLLEGLPVDGLTGDEANDSMGGMPHPIYPLDAWTTPHDPPHGWDPSHRQFNGGKNDGFVREYEADGSPDVGGVMGYYSRAQLPVLHALVDEYVLCERWYASVMGPTWPNRFHLHLATSDGMKTNDSVVGFPSLYDRLADKGVSARFYYGGLPFPLVYGTPFDAPHMAALAEFFDDAASGNLPAFSMIDPVFTALDMLGNDDHPPADVREGQAFLATLYNALAQSPNWERTLLVITYDEHGGFYDHAPPPKTFDDAYPEFQQLGFRVPTVIVGAQVRQGCAFSQGLDHVSVAATITRKFGLEPQNERVTKTPGFEAVIDPALITSPRPPIVLPQLRLARSPRLIVPGLHTGQLELAAAYERGDKYGRRRWQRASVDALEAIRDHGRRLGAIKLIG